MLLSSHQSVHQQQEDHRKNHLRFLSSGLIKTKDLCDTPSGINEAKISLIIPFRL